MKTEFPPSYCSENLEWHEFEEEFNGDAFNSAPAQYYQNIYDHLTNGTELAIKPKEVLKQIRVAELIHAQNPIDVKY